MDVVIAVAVGIVGGIVGVIPFIVSRARIKKRLKTGGAGSIVSGMAATFISFIVMVVEILICYFLAEKYLLPFAISAIAVFMLAMSIFTATLMRR